MPTSLVTVWPPPRRPGIPRVPLTEPPPEPWARRAHTVWERGLWITTVGVAGLAEALHRSSHMIRRMEARGVLPPAPIRDDIRGRATGVEQTARRAYPLDLVRDAAEIIADLGLLDCQPARWSETDFTRRVTTAWSARMAAIDRVRATHVATLHMPLRPDV